MIALVSLSAMEQDTERRPDFFAYIAIRYLHLPCLSFCLSSLCIASRDFLFIATVASGKTSKKLGLLSVFLFHGFNHVLHCPFYKCVILCWHSGNHDITHVGWKCLSETLRMRRKRLTFCMMKRFLIIKIIRKNNQFGPPAVCKTKG